MCIGSVDCSAAATLLGGSDLFATAECLGALERVSGLAGGLRLSHVVFDLASHSLEGSLDVAALLGRGLQEAHTVVVGHLLTLLEGHCTSVLKISLVTDQDPRDVVLSVLFDLAHPGVDSGERVAVGDVVDDDDAVGALVVA